MIHHLFMFHDVNGNWEDRLIENGSEGSKVN